MTEGNIAAAGTSSATAGERSSTAARPSSTVVKFGDRTRFTVELRSGETTIVSWKKLMKDASMAAETEGGAGENTIPATAVTATATASIVAPEVPTVSALETRLVAPGQPDATEDAPAPNRFNAVIEKIERLYMGKDSSDEEDNDIPDDDQYDTEDSFIDDAELDEYFQVDKSKTKHDGYFVNRGVLEKVIEPSEPAIQEPKKRKRKEVVKGARNDVDDQRPNKQTKVGKKAAGKPVLTEKAAGKPVVAEKAVGKTVLAEKAAEKPVLADKAVLPTSEGTFMKGSEETKSQNHQKISADGKPCLDPSSRIPQDDGSLTLAQISDNHKSQNHQKIAADGKPCSDPSPRIPHDDGGLTLAQISDNHKSQNHQKIAADDKPCSDPSSRIPHDDGGLTLAQISDNHKSGIVPAKNSSSKLKEGSGNGDTNEAMHKSHSLINRFEESEIVVHQKDKSAMREAIDLNLPVAKHAMQPVKNSIMHKKEGSSVKSRVNVLEKAIRELEKVVAESRPPAPDAQDGDSSSQAIKRRLPREIKQKLAKVARLANASSGNISKELLSRLMGIVGHLCQVRTLKRHLQIMVSTSLSAKQEKDANFQLIKKEVVEMIRVRVPSLMSKAAAQQSGKSGDLQESAHSEKVGQGKLFIDATLEDKICDLYDTFVDGLDEDVAPQVRKLYAELSGLWPDGVMDNYGIKNAICRAKERRKKVNEANKNQEKIKRKKVVPAKTDGTVRLESNFAAQPVATDPKNTVLTQHNRLPTNGVGTTTIPNNTAPALTNSTNVPNPDCPKQKKLKGTLNSSVSDARSADHTGLSVKKKIRKRAENITGEKLASHHADNRPKQQKHSAGGPLKSTSNGFRFEPLM